VSHAEKQDQKSRYRIGVVFCSLLLNQRIRGLLRECAV